MTTDVQHTDVAAYALGLLEEDDRRAFEAHLADCTLCAAEFGDFAGMAELLDDVSPVEPADGGGEVIGLLRRRKTAERARRRRTALLGAAAGVALLAGGGLTGALTAGPAGPARGAMPGHSSSSSSFDDVFSAGEKLTGADAATGVRGMVAMRTKGWGTDIGMELSRVKGPLVCKLVAVSRTGERRTVTEWGVPPQGYGFPGTPPSLQVHGGTAMDRADLARFDVQVGGSGRTLLSIPV